MIGSRWRLSAFASTRRGPDMRPCIDMDSQAARRRRPISVLERDALLNAETHAMFLQIEQSPVP